MNLNFVYLDRHYPCDFPTFIDKSQRIFEEFVGRDKRHASYESVYEEFEHNASLNSGVVKGFYDISPYWKTDDQNWHDWGNRSDLFPKPVRPVWSTCSKIKIDFTIG